MIEKPNLVVFAVVAVSLFSLGCQPSEITSANLYLQYGNLEDAAQQLEIAVGKYPESPDARFLLGITYGRLRRFEDMNREFDCSLQLSPKYSHEIIARREFYWTRFYDEGKEAFAEKDYDAAMSAFQTAIIIDSTQTRAHKNLVLVYIDTGRIEPALQLYRQLLRVTPDDLELLGSMALRLRPGLVPAHPRGT